MTGVRERITNSENPIAIMLSAQGIAWVAGELVARGKSEQARKLIKRCWKAVAFGSPSNDARASFELVIDEFFNHEGDMAKAAAGMWQALEENCPSQLWAGLQRTLRAANQAKLEQLLREPL